MTAADNPSTRYVVYDRIASGGMASVHFALLLAPHGFSRLVAVKRLHAHLSEVPEFRAMFIDEARLAARIRHPNVVAIADVIDGKLSLVMDYVHGESLSGLTKAHGEAGFPIQIAVRIALDAARGLHAAHIACDELGRPLHIVHRDVSPQNLLVGVDGITRIVDFGVAKAVRRLQTTQNGSIKGKLRYMAPEQVRSEDVTAAADVYALSVVLWETLTGARLFTATSEVPLLAQVLEGNLARPSSLRALPDQLESIVMRGLSRKPEDRFESAEALADALEALGVAASATEVGLLVRSLSQRELSAREKIIARIESGTADPSSDHDLCDVHVEGTLSAAGISSVPRAKEPRRRWPIVASTLVAALAVGAWFTRDRFASRPSTTTASTMASTITPAPVNAEVAPSTSMSSPVANIVATSAVSIATTATMRPARLPAIDCRQPKVLGADGVWRVRRECLK